MSRLQKKDNFFNLSIIPAKCSLLKIIKPNTYLLYLDNQFFIEIQSH